MKVPKIHLFFSIALKLTCAHAPWRYPALIICLFAFIIPPRTNLLFFVCAFCPYIPYPRFTVSIELLLRFTFYKDTSTVCASVCLDIWKIPYAITQGRKPLTTFFMYWFKGKRAGLSSQNIGCVLWMTPHCNSWLQNGHFMFRSTAFCSTKTPRNSDPTLSL